MLRLGARRSDDDLGAGTDRTGQVEGRAVTASSHGVRGRHSTSDIPSTSAPIAPGSSTQPPYTVYDPSSCHIIPSYFSRTQIPLNDVSSPGLQLGAQFFEQLAGSVPVDSSYSGAEYGATACSNSSSDGKGLTGSFMSVMSKIAGSRQKRPEKLHPPTNPTQRKKSKNDGWEQTCLTDGSPQEPIIIPSYSGHVAGCIWRGQDRGILKSRSRYVSLTGWSPSDPAMVQLVGETGLSHLSIGINAQDMAGVADSPRSGLSTE
ncbi:hypothetical protein M9H77_04666 [Catharanthus roseus]|uniref:Uncharacterized protein n=1 Tax=Catharanthus roseus TaxID=4058 RepID=A0ACC0CEN7_CATRO|nr:hypothetical protein M9H77_04666 [Catharanthus roseus]